MIVIRKKNIIYVSIIALLAIFIFGISENRIEDTAPTVALPVSNKVIVIDAGHGVPDERSTE